MWIASSLLRCWHSRHYFPFSVLVSACLQWHNCRKVKWHSEHNHTSNRKSIWSLSMSNRKIERHDILCCYADWWIKNDIWKQTRDNNAENRLHMLALSGTDTKSQSTNMYRYYSPNLIDWTTVGLSDWLTEQLLIVWLVNDERRLHFSLASNIFCLFLHSWSIFLLADVEWQISMLDHMLDLSFHCQNEQHNEIDEQDWPENRHIE